MIESLKQQPWNWKNLGLREALVFGLIVRVVATYSGYGWFAADDYYFALRPAYGWLTDPTVPFDSGIRSPLLAWVLWSFMSTGHALGLTSPVALIQFGYLGLGLLSVAVIPAVYRIAKEVYGDEVGRIAAWLAAGFALMPRISTRALIGTAVMALVAWGIWWCLRCTRDGSGRFAAGLFAALLLGAGAMFRFQVGLVAVAAFGWLAFLWGRDGARRSGVLGLVGFVVGGLAILMAQGFLDVVLGRGFMQTLWRYLEHNAEVSSKYGTSPFYTYLFHFVVYTVPPATLMLALPLWRAARKIPMVAVPFLFFVAVHSFVPHKEDRFMFPVLPLFFVVLAPALRDAWQQGGWARHAVRWFVAVNALGLVVAMTSDGQRNFTRPLLSVPATVRANEPTRLISAGFGFVPTIYLDPNVQHRAVRKWEQLAAALNESTGRPDFVFARRPDAERIEKISGGACASEALFTGDWVDRMAVALNPENNKRRAPTALYRCHW